MPEEQAPEPVGKPRRGLFGLIVAVVVLLLAATSGLVTYKLVVAPRLQQDEEPAPDSGDTIPAMAVACDFDEMQASVQSDDPAGANCVLMYAVSLICANPQTQMLVEKNRQWFISKLDELHRNRTKTELSDPQIQKEIARLALQEANSLIRRFQQVPDPEIRIIEVLHLKFSVFDL